MKKEEYQVLYNIEEDYWWYVGLRNLVTSYVGRFMKKRSAPRMLDAGCGTGKTLSECQPYDTYGMDYSEDAIAYSRSRSVANLARGSISQVPFKSETFDIVLSLDVLYHRNVESDVAALRELHRVMQGSGRLLLNLPAYNFLRSRHDEAIHTQRRYTVRGLREKLETAGFTVEIITYRNTVLFPITVIMRVVKKLFPVEADHAESDLKPMPVLLNKIFTSILFLENRLIEAGVRFPCGLSVFCVARKKSG